VLSVSIPYIPSTLGFTCLAATILLNTHRLAPEILVTVFFQHHLDQTRLYDVAADCNVIINKVSTQKLISVLGGQNAPSPP
jgi:hypothetical protein